MEIWEILTLVANEKTKEGKAKVLIANDSIALRSIMRVNFDPDLILYVSDDITYTPAPNSSEWYTTLKNETKNLVPLAKKGGMPQQRADYKYQSILESMDPRDAKILDDARKKKLKVKGLTLKLAEEVWGRRIFN